MSAPAHANNHPERDKRGRWTAVCKVHSRRRNLECLAQEADGSYVCRENQKCRSGKDGRPRSVPYLCPDCDVILNSKQQAHVHVLGFRHQDRVKHLMEESNAKGISFVESSLVPIKKNSRSNGVIKKASGAPPSVESTAVAVSKTPVTTEPPTAIRLDVANPVVPDASHNVNNVLVPVASASYKPASLPVSGRPVNSNAIPIARPVYSVLPTQALPQHLLVAQPSSVVPCAM